MKTPFEDILLRIAIFAFTLRIFSFIKEGYGYFEPATIILILMSLILIARQLLNRSVGRRIETVSILGTNLAFFSIPVFFGVAITASFISQSLGLGTTTQKAISVLASLISFFAIYYSVSAVNRTWSRAENFFKTYLLVSVIICGSVILEGLITVATDKNWTQIFISGLVDSLPYPHFRWGVTSLRFRGLMIEPGDVGTYTLPALSAMLASIVSNLKSRKIYRFDLIGFPILLVGNLLSVSFTGIAVLFAIIAYYLPQLVQSFVKSRRNAKRSALDSNRFRLKQVLQIGTVAIFLGFLLASGYSQLPLDIRDRVDSFLLIFSDPSRALDVAANLNLSVAVTYYSTIATLYSLQQNWLLGVGLGGHGASYDAVTSNAIASAALGLNKQDAYSMLLRLLSEVGILGTASFVSIFLLRWVQRRRYISRLLSSTKPDAQAVAEVEKTQRIFAMIHSAMLVELCFILLNEPTFFNPVPPLLLGLCWKASYAKASSRRSSEEALEVMQRQPV